MYQTFKQSLSSWNDATSDRQKLQHMYMGVAGLLLVVAGVLGLLNQALGQQILAIAIAAAGIFLVNAIAWALLQSFVLFRLNTQNRSQKAITLEVSVPRKKTTKK